jgi:hypothetical protein
VEGLEEALAKEQGSARKTTMKLEKENTARSQEENHVPGEETLRVQGQDPRRNK